MSVNEGTEGQTVFEGQVEVLNVDVLVWRGLALAPKEETFLEVRGIISFISKRCNSFHDSGDRWIGIGLLIARTLSMQRKSLLKCTLAVISSTEMSWMANLRMIVQIIPRVIFRLPSTISSAPIDTSFTPENDKVDLYCSRNNLKGFKGLSVGRMKR